MESKTTLRSADFLIVIVCTIAFICFPASTLLGNTNFAPPTNQKVYVKIKRLNEVVETFLQKGQLDQAGKFAK